MDCATNFAVGGTYAGYCNLACGFCECRNLYDVAQQSPGACDTLLDSGAYSCADTFAPGMVYGFNFLHACAELSISFIFCYDPHILLCSVSFVPLFESLWLWGWCFALFGLSSFFVDV